MTSAYRSYRGARAKKQYSALIDYRLRSNGVQPFACTEVEN